MDDSDGGPRPTPAPGPLYVASLAKGLRLMRAFDETATDMSLGELAQKTGLGKSVTQRLANTLHLEGFLEKDPVTRRFSPSLVWLELAYAYYWSDPLVAAAMPKLIDLSQRIGETVNLARLRGTDLIYVSRLPSKRSSFGAITIGRCLPAVMTAAGQAIVSTWPEEARAAPARDWPLRRFTERTVLDRAQIHARIAEAADRGFAITQGQILPDETSIAVAIRGPGGIAAAAVQCSVSSHSWTLPRIHEQIVPAVVDAANSISPGYSPAP